MLHRHPRCPSSFSAIVGSPREQEQELDQTTLILLYCTAFNNSRYYWKPQLEDPLLSSFTKIAIDAPGFAHSRTQPAGSAWSFDLAAAGVLAILDQEIGDGEQLAVVVGDSMGGAHTGLRAALRDEERRDGKKGRIAGVVACGTAAEEESAGELALSKTL